GDFIAQYRDTITFAKLVSSGKMNGDGAPEAKGPKVALGDFVQWTSQGADVFAEPRRVTGLSDDGQYAFFENQKSGVPVDQLTVQSPKGDRKPETKPSVA